MSGHGARGERAPLVSIVVPTFRRPVLLAQALRSLTQQSFTDFEALVCDNANDPCTRKVCEDLDDPRIVYIPRPENLGMLANVVDGFSRSRGAYILELDDDDVLLPDGLRDLVEGLEACPDAALAFGSYSLIDGHGQALTGVNRRWHRKVGWDAMARGRTEDVTRLVTIGAIQAYASLCRREVIDWTAIPESVKTAFDLHLLLVAARSGRPAVFVGTDVMGFRVHPEAETALQRVAQLEGARAALGLAEAEAIGPDRVPIVKATEKVEVELVIRLIGLNRHDEATAVLANCHIRRPSRLLLSGLAALPTPVIEGLRQLRGRFRRKDHRHREVGAGANSAAGEPSR